MRTRPPSAMTWTRLAAAIVALAFVARAQDALTFVSQAYGFAVQKPDSSWVVYGGDGSGAAAYTAGIYPRDAVKRGSLPRAGINVFPAADERDAGSRRDALVLALRRGGIGVTNLEDELAGRKVAGASWEQEERGVKVRMAARYLFANGFTYEVSEVRASSDAASDEALAKIRSTFALSDPPGGADGPALRTLAARCGTDLVWEPGWDAAAARARREDRLVLVVYEYYSVLAVPHTLASGAFMDPDLASLLRERFVAVRLGPGDPAPFRAPKAYGMSPYSWGSAVLFAADDGRILGETGIGDASLIYGRAREALRKDAASRPASRPASAPAAAADLLLRRGEVELALEHLKDARSGRGLYERARAHRILGRFEEARRDLRDARSAMKGVEGSAMAFGDFDAEDARVLMRMGRFDDAEAMWGKALDYPAMPARRSEARFWLGALEMLREGSPHGREHWERLVKESPESPWAAKAAANLLGQGALVNGAERLDRPSAARFAEASTWKPATASATELAGVERDAVAWLLKSQAEDGSWSSPIDAFTYVHMGYREAITALAGSALLRFADRPDAQRAAERARAFIVASRQGGVLGDAGESLGAYGTWARAFALRFLSRCVARKLGPAGETSSEARALARSLMDRQHESGGWPYVVVAGSGEGGLCSSFLSAAVLSALVEARAAGVAVSARVTDRGAAFLRSLLEEGTFRYAPDVPGSGGDDVSAAGRGPACALALERCGDSDHARLARALDAFDRHRGSLASELRKDLCHTGPEGIASYYFFFDHLFAAEATGLLRGPDRSARARSIRDSVLAARGDDGAFLDMPSIGRAYGTAMALLIFEALSEGL